jgi:hypothetical protein
MTAREWARGFFFLLLAVVTYMTLTTEPEKMKPGFDLMDFVARMVFGDPKYGDKVAHFSAYGALGLAAVPAGFRLVGRDWTVIPALAVYGELLEFVQGLGGVRQADPFDALANVLGATIGFFGARLLIALWTRRIAA